MERRETLECFTHFYTNTEYTTTENHWVLLVLDIESKNIVFLDPLQLKLKTLPVTAVIISERILKEKLQEDPTQYNHVLNEPHVIQKDSISCGSLICFYSKLLT